jgi:predicted ATP-grasp superfamily ATP-dependent carboligase
VIKPNIGFGAIGISYVNSLKELEDIYEKTIKNHGPSHIQEFIKGIKYSSSALFNQDSLPRRGCVQQSLRQLPITGGSQIYVISVKQPQILGHTFELLKALKWYGIAELEFIIDDKDKCPKLLDLNPRLYGSVCLPIAAGVDYPYLLYRLAMDGDVEPNFNYKLGVKCRYIFPNEFKYLFSILRNRQYKNKNLENFGDLRVLLNFIQFYEPKLNYFVMSADDPFPAVVNSIQYIGGFIQRKICKLYDG